MKTDKKNQKKEDPKQKSQKLSPYKQYLYNKDKKYEAYKQKYFEYHDDVKDKTHKIIDW